MIVIQATATIAAIQRKLNDLRDLLNERSLRQWAATEARALGHGGVMIVHMATGLSRTTIHDGLRELNAQQRENNRKQRTGKQGKGNTTVTVLAPERIRAAGGGRKSLSSTDPLLLPALHALVAPVTRGDPESTLLWRAKSTEPLLRN